MKTLLKRVMKLSVLALMLTLTGCVYNEVSYVVYNHENGGGLVPLYTTTDIETAKPAKYIPSRSECALMEVKAAKGVHQIGLGKVTLYVNDRCEAEEEYYVKSKYVREKISKHKMGLIVGGGEYDRFKVIYERCYSPAVKKAYEMIHQWQESEFHYRWTNLTALGGLLGSFLLFFIAFGVAVTNESKYNLIYGVVTFLAGLVFLFFEVIYFVVLGGGYVPFIKFRYPDNLWQYILPAIPYLANLLLMAGTMIVVLWVPIIMGKMIAKNKSRTEDEDGNTVAFNFYFSGLAYVGTCVSLFLPYDFDIAFIVSISIVTALYLFLTIRELCKGNLWGLLYLLFPLIHVITGAAIYRISSMMLHMTLLVAICVFFVVSLLSGIGSSGFNPFAGGGRGGGGSRVSLDGQELDSVTPSHGYNEEFRNPANGECYGSNDGGRTLNKL